MKNKQILQYVILLFLTITVANSQPSEIFIAGGPVMDFHHASFTQLGQYASCCPEFSGGTGLGLWLGAGLTFPLNSTWRLGGSVVYTTQNGSMTYDEHSFVADLRQTPTVRDAIFRHELTSSIQSIGLEPRIMIRPFGALDVGIGLRMAYILSAHFHQTETLTAPEDYGAYLGAGRTWVNHDAAIPDAASIYVGMLSAIRYSIPLNNHAEWSLQPEVAFVVPFTSVTSAVQWSISDLRFGIGIARTLTDHVEILPDSAPVLPAIDTVQAPSPIIPDAPTASISVRGLVHGKPVEFDTVRIEETRIVDYLPVLPYVFFDSHSAIVPNRFISQATAIKVGTNISADSQAVVSVLGIIATRLLNNPDATITLTGCATDEEAVQNTSLSKQRAEAVKQQFLALGVPAARISIRSRRMPVIPTRASNPSDTGIANVENQRVEIQASHQEIFAPIVMSTTARTVVPDTLIINAQTLAPAGIARWKYQPRLGRPTSPTAWNVAVVHPSPLSTDSVFIEVTDSLARTARDAQEIPVANLSVERKLTENRNDAEVERYSLILFGFDDATVTDAHRSVLSRIQDKVRQGAQVHILGMTDAMGSDAYNLELSRRRASEVAKVLNLGDNVVQALGASNPRFDNSTPEGRSYNRTVVIELRTPRP